MRLFRIGVLAILLLGCEKQVGKVVDNDTSTADTASDREGTTASNSAGDADTGASDFEVCGEVTSDLTAVATRVMLLQDRSGSMLNDDKWNLAMSAISGMVNAFGNQIAFGLDLFPHYYEEFDGCAVSTEAVLDVQQGNAAGILTELNTFEPAGATPLRAAINNFGLPGFAPVFQDKTAKSYLVIISDGIDTCTMDGEYEQMGGATNEELALVTTELRESHGIYTIVIGFGAGVEPDQLNAVAAAGGTDFDQYISAENGDDLAAALQSIAQTVLVSCQFQTGTFDDPDANLDLVNVTFDGVPVPRDDDCAANTGWSWADAERTVIQFCDTSCAKLESETVEALNVQVACSAEDVVVIE